MSTQPQRNIDMTTVHPTNGLRVIQQLLIDRPSFHLSGEAHWDCTPGTLQGILRSVQDGDSTIETGAGASTVLFAAAGATHTAISPSADEHQRIREYCERIDVDHSRVNFVVGLSDDVLPAMLSRDRVLDAAFIDGAHSFPFPEVDWYYITRALKVGGRMLLDDIPIPAVTPVFRHMALEPHWRLDGIYDDRAAAFTLLALPQPEDWTNQPFNKGFPDLSFAGSVPERLRLEAAYRVKQLRSGTAERFPVLRRVLRRQ
jgi:predicted O-methyltransferase YrrM